MKESDPFNWKNCNVTDKDILCVSLAALLHDIGHGPWSHFWDGSFIPSKMVDTAAVDINGKVVRGLKHPYREMPEYLTEWTHEIASLKIIDHIWKTNSEVQEMCALFDITNDDIEFIKELIDPNGLKDLPDLASWSDQMKGRTEEKAFLYEVVSNKRNGLDVDKLDYLKRDLKYCKGTDVNIDYIRLFQNMKIEFTKGNGNRSLISIRDKCDSDVMEVFKLREKNHREM